MTRRFLAVTVFLAATVAFLIGVVVAGTMTPARAASPAPARRELAASLALARPGSPVRVPVLARLAAIDAELAGRPAARPGLPASPCARPLNGGHAG